MSTPILSLALRRLSIFSAALIAIIFTMQANAQPTPTAERLTIIGASYAQGWGQPILPGYQVLNKGVGGEESWQVAARFVKDALSTKPNVVLIWGHINDITRTSPDKYSFAKQRAMQSYKQMIADARAANVQVILATEMTLPTALSWREWIPAFAGWVRGKESYAARVNREVKAINAWLRETAANEKLCLLDLEKAVDDGSGGRRPEFAQEDRSHITPAGYAAITAFAQRQLPR